MRARPYMAAALTLLTGLVWAEPAQLKPLRGEVYVQHPNKDLWEPVKAPTAVQEGDRIKTHNDSAAFMVLPDDHRVAIGPDTFMTLERVAEGETKLYLKSGSVRSKVRHLQRDLGQFYKIQTPTAVVAVRGTDFSVIQAAAANIHVFEGVVDLSALRKDIANAVTQVEAGHSAAMDPSGQVQPGPAPTSTPPDTKGKEGDQPVKKDDQGPDQHHGNPPPPPPGSGPAAGQGGPAWYDHPENITPGIFKSDTDGMAPNGPPTTRPGPGQPPPPPPNWNNTSFNPLSGTGLENPPPPNGPAPFNPYSPPPTGNTNTTTLGDPSTLGTQALMDTIRAQNLQTQLQGLLVAGLYQDGSVKLGPDGLWHQYADSINLTAPDQVEFLNATMIANQPNTLNYQKVWMKYNTTLPTSITTLAAATRTGFRGDPLGASPSYYVTDFSNYRTNMVDNVTVTGSGGNPIFDSAISRYVTKFSNENCKVNGTTLYSTVGANTTYLGGAAPTAQYNIGSGQANVDYRNTYSNGVFLGRHVTYFNPDTQQMANLSMAGGTANALSYLGGPTLVTQDTLVSNLFTKGPILSFASAQSRIFSGIDSVHGTGDASAILNGQLPVGLPDGLLRL